MLKKLIKPMVLVGLCFSNVLAYTVDLEYSDEVPAISSARLVLNGTVLATFGNLQQPFSSIEQTSIPTSRETVNQADLGNLLRAASDTAILQVTANEGGDDNQVHNVPVSNPFTDSVMINPDRVYHISVRLTGSDVAALTAAIHNVQSGTQASARTLDDAKEAHKLLEANDET